MRRVAHILATLMLCLGCTTDPQAPVDIPGIAFLSASDITSHSATVSGVYVGKPAPGIEYILWVQADEEVSISSTPNDYGMLQWMVDGLDAETAYNAYVEIRSAHGSIVSKPITFSTLKACVTFKDKILERFCVEHYDRDKDGRISFEEAALITDIDVAEQPVMSLAGIEYMTSLTNLYCNDCKLSGALDLSHCIKLEQIYLDSSALSSITFGSLPKLRMLALGGNPITDLNFDGTPNISSLGLRGTLCPEEVVNRELAKLPELMYLNVSYNLYQELDLSAQKRLIWLDCWDNYLTTLDLTPCADHMVHVTATHQMLGAEIDTIYVRAGQVIDGITINRDPYFIAPTTVVAVK